MSSPANPHPYRPAGLTLAYICMLQTVQTAGKVEIGATNEPCLSPASLFAIIIIILITVLFYGRAGTRLGPGVVIAVNFTLGQKVARKNEAFRLKKDISLRGFLLLGPLRVKRRPAILFPLGLPTLLPTGLVVASRQYLGSGQCPLCSNYLPS